MAAYEKVRDLTSWMRISCGAAAFLGLLAALVAMAIAGFWAYNSIDDQVSRLRQQLDRAQDQFDRVLDNNDEALEMYDEILVDIDANRRELRQQLARAIERNEDALRLYDELLVKAGKAGVEADELPSDLQNFRAEVARLAVETNRLNVEIALVQGDVRFLGREIVAVAEEIEDFRAILDQVLAAINAGR